LSAEQLGGVHRRIRRDTACQVDRVANVYLPRSSVLSRCMHLTANPNRRSKFKVVSAEDSDRIKRLKLWCGGGIRKSCRQVKAFYARPIVRRVEPHDLRVSPRWFGQQILV